LFSLKSDVPIRGDLFVFVFDNYFDCTIKLLFLTLLNDYLDLLLLFELLLLSGDFVFLLLLVCFLKLLLFLLLLGIY
jgi:hypothetical protein